MLCARNFLSKIFCVCFVFVLAEASFLCPAPTYGSEPLKVHFMNVGYGDAVLLQLPNRLAFLVDAGGQETFSRLRKYFKKYKISHLEGAVITHPHKNHFGGFFPLIHQYPVKQFFINGDDQKEEGYQEILGILQRKSIPVKTLKQGDLLNELSPGVEIVVLNPNNLEGSVNANAIVLWIKYGKVSILLLSDIDPQRCDEIIKEFPFIQESSVVQIPHHGDGVSELFLKTFRDKIFLISTGKNPWGLPRGDDVKKLQGTVFRTDRDGTVGFETDGRALKRIQ